MMTLIEIAAVAALIPTLLFGKYVKDETSLWNAIVTSPIWMSFMYGGFSRVGYMLALLPSSDVYGILYLLSYPSAGIVWFLFGQAVGRKWTPILLGAVGFNMGLLFWMSAPVWLFLMFSGSFAMRFTENRLP